MGYSSDVTDKEWEIIEPLLPTKKKTRPPMWTKRQILNGIFYQLKNGCNWADLSRDLPPYSTVFWHYKQWCKDGTLDPIMTNLHGRVREQVKKTFDRTLTRANAKLKLCFIRLMLRRLAAS